MKMEHRSKEEEIQRLRTQIAEWNANRLDLFEITPPNEDLEFYGVMRFFFQETGEKVATKCIRVSSTATTRDILNVLVEKFHPDMKMLSLPKYALYEVHVNGDERRLRDTERPLYVQLYWGKDDREGRFLLKSEDDKVIQKLSGGIVSPQSHGGESKGSFIRKLSKREKKEAKKAEKLAMAQGKENETPNTAEKLYTELPETSFTRSISNPEAVMRRRRQIKLEKKLQEIKSKDGGPDEGGTLKIYGETLRPDLPYKTLLLSMNDYAAYVVKETLDKYGLDKEDPAKYCLVQVISPPTDPALAIQDRWRDFPKEFMLEDFECPLSILMQHPPSERSIMFQLRKRTSNLKTHKKKKGYTNSQAAYTADSLPYLMPLHSDGSLAYKLPAHYLPPDVTEIGSDKSAALNGHHIQLSAGDILARHAVITNRKGVITITPTQRDAEVTVDNQHIYTTTLITPGCAVRFGRSMLFRLCSPSILQTSHPDELKYNTDDDVQSVPAMSSIPAQPDMLSNAHSLHDTSPIGNVSMEDILPATLEYRDDAEELFLSSVISEINGLSIQFKLAPTYVLYMAVRYCISSLYRPEMGPQERALRITKLSSKIAVAVQQTIRENKKNASSLSFWMANASELLHFFKQDMDVSRFSMEAQDLLADAVQEAFRQLVLCMQHDISSTMLAFLEDSDKELHEPGDVQQVLSSAMSLLRRCRVNAALTIQLFSQLFHYINMWLFNKVVMEPQRRLCMRKWGVRLKRRLASVELWAEKQGLELAADCHLARIIQAAHLLVASKSSHEDITAISSSCFKLNSLQIRTLLQNYVPEHDEPPISPNFFAQIVAVAESTADELTRSDGRQVRFEEDAELNLPFLLPDDGYSCDIIRGVPSGLSEFVSPIAQSGMCRMTIQPLSSGSWIIYMMPALSEDHRGPEDLFDLRNLPPEPEILHLTFSKVNGSIGLSIVAAKGEQQQHRGVYVKTVVANGAAAQDGRLHAGDQLLQVDGQSLNGLTQERAAEIMTRTGHTVTLKVAKQGAIYHGLGPLLSQPSPILHDRSVSTPQLNNNTPPGYPTQNSPYGTVGMAAAKPQSVPLSAQQHHLSLPSLRHNAESPDLPPPPPLDGQHEMLVAPSSNAMEDLRVDSLPPPPNIGEMKRKEEQYRPDFPPGVNEQAVKSPSSYDGSFYGDRNRSHLADQQDLYRAVYPASNGGISSQDSFPRQSQQQQPEYKIYPSLKPSQQSSRNVYERSPYREQPSSLPPVNGNGNSYRKNYSMPERPGYASLQEKSKYVPSPRIPDDKLAASSLHAHNDRLSEGYPSFSAEGDSNAKNQLFNKMADMGKKLQDQHDHPPTSIPVQHLTTNQPQPNVPLSPVDKKGPPPTAKKPTALKSHNVSRNGSKAPPTPERKSSYGVVQRIGEATRSNSLPSSARDQLADEHFAGEPKKSVSFHSNLATEMWNEEMHADAKKLAFGEADYLLDNETPPPPVPYSSYPKEDQPSSSYQPSSPSYHQPTSLPNYPATAYNSLSPHRAVHTEPASKYSTSPSKYSNSTAEYSTPTKYSTPLAPYHSSPDSAPPEHNSASSSYNFAPTHSTYNSGPTHSTYNSAPTHSTYNSAPNHPNYNSAPTQSPYNSTSNHSSYNSVPNHSSYNSGPNHSSYNSAPNHSSYNSGPNNSSYNSAPNHTTANHAAYNSAQNHSSYNSAPNHSAPNYPAPNHSAPNHASYNSAPNHSSYNSMSSHSSYNSMQQPVNSYNSMTRGEDPRCDRQYFNRSVGSPHIDQASAETPHTPVQPQPTFVVGSTPNVVGTQEIYRDPRDRIQKSRSASLQQQQQQQAPAERMSFREKMKMFASQAGENSPLEKAKHSYAQREIETNILTPIGSR